MRWSKHKSVCLWSFKRDRFSMFVCVFFFARFCGFVKEHNMFAAAVQHRQGCIQFDVYVHSKDFPKWIWIKQKPTLQYACIRLIRFAVVSIASSTTSQTILMRWIIIKTSYLPAQAYRMAIFIPTVVVAAVWCINEIRLYIERVHCTPLLLSFSHQFSSNHSSTLTYIRFHALQTPRPRRVHESA